MALSATAPPDTLLKLKECYRNAFVSKSTVDRPNISLHVRKSKYGGQLPTSVANGKTSAGIILYFENNIFGSPSLLMYPCRYILDSICGGNVKEIGDSPTIIYVDSKKAAIDLTTSFNQHTEIRAAAYTGEETSKSDKKHVLARWIDDDITLVVATSAFGLGVNKANVRYVYHLGVPPTLEAWVQEAGRGGRDGEPCQGYSSYHVIHDTSI